MTDNLFDNAKFGDMYLTTEKKQAIFLRFAENAEYKFAILYVEDWGTVQVFRHNGKEIYNDASHSIISKQEVPVSEDLEEELDKYIKDNFTIDKEQLDRFGLEEKDYMYSMDKSDMLAMVRHFVDWQQEQMMKNIWKPADGNNLPIIDREVIALLDSGKVVFAHRPPEYWDGKNITTGKVTRNYPKTYDKGGWNVPNIKYWLDVELPKEIEL